MTSPDMHHKTWSRRAHTWELVQSGSIYIGNAEPLPPERSVRMTSFAGAIIFKDMQKTLVFKNRDLKPTTGQDELFYDIDCFGIRGLDSHTGGLSGLAIGVNRYGLAVANTHVKTTNDPSYDILTEQILMFAKDVEDGLKMTRDHLEKGRRYQWGNLVLADADGMLAIEIAGDEHSIEWSEKKVIRTGHHILLDTEDEVKKATSAFGLDTYYDDSTKRVERGYELLRSATKVDDVFDLLRDHGSAPGSGSICKHADGVHEFSTAASYVIEIDFNTETGRPQVVFHVAKGLPCQSTYTAIPLVFPADDDIMRRARALYFGTP